VTGLAQPWFERWPELLNWELGRFAIRGLPARVDDAQQGRGRLVIATKFPFGSADVELTIAYPSEYPELPPSVATAPGLLERHQHPFGGNFCLLERPLDDWPARDWGAADLVAEQLARLLRDSTKGADAVAAAEAPVPEPITAFFRYARDAAVLLPTAVARPEGDGGTLRIRRATPHIFLVEAADGKQADAEVLQLFPPGETLKVPWRRLDRAPLDGTGDGPSVARWIRQHLTGMLLPRLPPKLRNVGRMRLPTSELVALLVPEEGPAVGEMRDGWLFVLVDHTVQPAREFLVHAQVISAEERARRIPELEGLGDHHAVVLGAGSLGGDIAIELAKAGMGALEIIDFDRFEFGNTVRHRLDIQYSGLPKSQAVALACRRANPFCAANSAELRFGVDDWLDGEMPLERFTALVSAADVVIDATGSHQIAQFASRVCTDADVPFVAGWLTEGAYGAEIVRIVPGSTCCWTCFATAHRMNRLAAAEAGPPSTIVPQGCGFPTSFGAGFDVAEAAANVARLVVQTLRPDGGYATSSHDYIAISFRRPPNDPTRPRFQTEALSPTQECSQCLVAVGAIAAP
jgi:hypothetical protein